MRSARSTRSSGSWRGRKAVGALSIVDAAQAAPHLPLDVQALGADFVAFTGHKLYGPTGVGVLWGRYELLAELPPFMGGGEMIETVDMTGTTYATPPHRFEAGTPMIAQAVGLGTAIDYLTALGMDNVRDHEHELVDYALDVLQKVPDLRIIGPATAVDRGATIAFTVPYAPSARRGPTARRAGHRGSGRAPLRPSGLRALRHPRDHPGVVRHLHDDRGNRRPGQRLAAGEGDVCMSLPMESMYQQIILDHYKHPQHHALLEDFDAEVHHVNPTCGDEVTLRVNVEDGKIADLGWDGQGCSISQASTSVMSELVVGEPVEHALELSDVFLELMNSRGSMTLTDEQADELDDAVAFEGVSKYPARIKCALLGWMAMKSAVAQASAMTNAGDRT